MQDDSVSDITDLEKDQILAKYYNDRMTYKERRAKERTETRRRLGIETDEHLCKGPPNQYTIKGHDDIVEMEIRTRDYGVVMKDDELSAHQFSFREVSIQADEEERLDMEMHLTKFENQDQSPASQRGHARRNTTKS